MLLRTEELELEKEKFDTSKEECQGKLEVMKAMLSKMK